MIERPHIQPEWIQSHHCESVSQKLSLANTQAFQL
jgi:hypothetical protein